jgi:hypothetical protein
MELPYARPSRASVRSSATASVRASMRQEQETSSSSGKFQMPDYTTHSRGSYRPHNASDFAHFLSDSAHAHHPSSSGHVSMSNGLMYSSIRQSSLRALEDAEASSLSFIDVGKKASLLNSGYHDRSESQNADGSASDSNCPPPDHRVPLWIRIL